VSSHVLIVDDDPDMVDIIGAILGSAGYAFRTARTGIAALDAIDRERPAVVLLDMLMPVMNGWQAAEEIHHRYGRTVPIVVVTAAEHAEARAREVDADGVLAKPFEIDDLLRIVNRYCGHPRSQVVHRIA
jgi:CheY-like chemotaxis protein